MIIGMEARTTNRIKDLCETRFSMDPQSIAITSGTLRKQYRSVIRLHRVTGAGGTVAIIEKRARTRAEAVFYRQASALAGSGLPDIFPDIYGIENRRAKPQYLTFCSSVLMERVSISEIRDFIPNTPAKALAKTITSIAAFGGTGLKIPDSRVLRPGDVTGFVRHCRNRGLVPPDAEARLDRMAQTIPQILQSAQFTGLPLIACHNDIHRRNIGVRTTGETSQVVLLDWESLAINRAGSDLHYFLGRDVRPKFQDAYFATLLSQYRDALSGRHDLKARDLELGASVYALYRAIARYKKATAPDKGMFNQVIRIFKRIERVRD
jgi:hypothetical protein